MTTTQLKKAVIYCRVSTKEQVEEGNSLPTQEKICRDYALKNGYEIAEVFIEQGESAKTAHRTELQRLLNYCALKKHEVKAVIAYKLDRISRNTDDYSQIRLLLKRYGVEIKSTSEYFENTPAGRFMENIIANVAQFDNDVRTERCVGGLREAVREGRYVWTATLGYNNSKITGKSNIVPNEMAPLVRKAFELLSKELYSVDEVHRQVTNEGLRTRSGKRVTKSHFHRLLRNELYAGWINKFGERHKGTFEPIVPEALFKLVQNILKGRKRTMGSYQWENPDFPLRRFVRNEAGTILTGSWCKGRNKKYPYYRFKGESWSIKKDDLEASFNAFVNQFGLDDKHYKEFKASLDENLVRKTEEQQKEETSMKASLVALKEKQGQLIQKNLEGFLSNNVLREQLAILENEILTLELRLSSNPRQHKDFSALAQTAAGFLITPGDTWTQAPFHQKVRLQWFQFPQGVIFDGKEFRTARMCCLFNVKETISPSMSLRADSKQLRLNTYSLATSSTLSNLNKETWEQIGDELTELEKIFCNKGESKLQDQQQSRFISPEEYLGLAA